MASAATSATRRRSRPVPIQHAKHAVVRVDLVRVLVLGVGGLRPACVGKGKVSAVSFGSRGGGRRVPTPPAGLGVAASPTPASTSRPSHRPLAWAAGVASP